MKKIKILKILSSLVLILALNYNGFAVNDATKFKNKIEDVKEGNVKQKDRNKDEKIEEKQTKKNINKEEKKIKEKKKKKEEEKEKKKKKEEEKEKKKKKEEEKEKKKEEKKKKKEEEKNIKEHEKLEKEQIKKNKAKFKNFKKNDFEKDGFSLKIVKKAGVPLLHYVHNRTKANVVFILVDKKHIEELNLFDGIFFKKFSDNDGGLAHFSEHYISKFMSPFLEKYENGEFNFLTYKKGLKMVCKSGIEYNDLLFKKFYESLSSSDLFKNENFFKIQKKRIKDEIEMKKSGLGFDISEADIFYGCTGDKESIKKVRFEDVKRFYEKYIHPSNMCITKHITFNRNKIFEFLDNLENMYLKKFGYKKTKDKLKRKNRKRFMEIEVPAKSVELFLDMKKGKRKFKYCGEVVYDLDELNIKLEECEGLDFDFFKGEKYVKKISKFVENLGYKNWFYRFLFDPNIGKKFLVLNLKSDDGELFKEKVLKNNLKKILEKIKEILKNAPEKQMQYIKRVCGYQRYPVEEQKDGALQFSKAFKYNVEFFLVDLIDVSFAKYGEPFSPKIFYINRNNKENELIDSKENILEKTKNNFDVFDVLNKKNLEYITVFKGNENKNIEKNSDYIRLILPIKFKDFKNNKIVYLMAGDFVGKKLGYSLSFEKGFCYNNSADGKIYAGDYIGALNVNKNNKNIITEYLKKNFGEFVKKLKYKRSDFDKEIKERKKFFSGEKYEEFLKQEKEKLKTIENLIKEVDYFCETGKTHKDGPFTKDSLTQDVVDMWLLQSLHVNLGDFLIYNNRKEYEKLVGSGRYEGIISFVSNVYKQKSVNITKQFMKDYKKYFLNYLYDLSKHRIKCVKEQKKLIDTVRYEDVLNTIKTAYVCVDKDYKKDSKMLEKRIEYAKKLFTL